MSLGGIQAPRDGTTVLTLVTRFESMPAGSLRGLVLRSPDLASDYEELVAGHLHR